MKNIQTDVLVCGGGCAGIAAALSSARNGAKTLLIERAGFSGGIITTVGLPYFDGLIDKPSGRFVVKGIALELLQKLGVAKDGAKHIDDLRPDLINPLFPALRSDPMALSGASRRKQIPSSDHRRKVTGACVTLLRPVETRRSAPPSIGTPTSILPHSKSL